MSSPESSQDSELGVCSETVMYSICSNSELPFFMSDWNLCIFMFQTSSFSPIICPIRIHCQLSDFLSVIWSFQNDESSLIEQYFLNIKHTKSVKTIYCTQPYRIYRLSILVMVIFLLHCNSSLRTTDGAYHYFSFYNRNRNTIK